tara:strand:+ start:1204 stop:1905 length:702 start_codon:yes stop_codon:yes gene_type:complete
LKSQQYDATTRIAEIERQQKALRDRLDTEQANLRELARRLWAQQESEKARLSRELHDGIGQLLTGLTRRLQSLSTDNNEFLALTEIAELALADVRQLSRMMSPTILDDLGLKPALKWLCRNLLDAENIDYTCDIALKSDIPKEQAILLFRICQEALVNAVKHSEANRIQISLHQHHQIIRLDITDNGKGFDTAAVEKGIGLSSMADRASAFDAELQLDSKPDLGTHITLTVSL